MNRIVRAVKSFYDELTRREEEEEEIQWENMSLPGPVLGGDGFGRVYIATGRSLKRTDNFSSASPDWLPVYTGPPHQRVYNFNLDVEWPAQRGLLWTSGGLFWSEDLSADEPHFECILEFRDEAK